MNPHRGYLHERTIYNPLEAAFAKKWEEENVDGKLLHGIVSDKETFTKSECYVVATVIQWLGTNVGISFVESCLMRCGHGLKWMAYRDDKEPLLATMHVAIASAESYQELFDLSEPH